LSELCLPWLKGTLHEEKILQEDDAAFGDLPIPLMYRDLYEMYPEAKYVCVLRNRQDWLGSIREHMTLWKGVSPIHTMVYGHAIQAANQDDDTLLRGYDRITGEVLRFFSGKHNFLCLRLETLGWEPLCSFLGKPVPEKPFPWVNKYIPPVDGADKPGILPT
jgi:hypothetical protein